jgi:G3E family GTPase
MAQVLLISGFLGAGKTTLVQNLLTSRTEGLGKVAVLVNEVGEIGIDGTLLSGQDVDIVELTGGCICCTQTGAFLKALHEIRDRVAPDFLLIETSGVAQPAEMFVLLEDPSVSEFFALRSVVTVVDASFFEAREVLGPFYDNQIQAGDVILLNKIDQADEARLREIEAQVRGLNSRARLLRTERGAIDLGRLLARNPSRAAHGARQEPAHEHHGWGFQTFSFEEERPLDEARFSAFLEALPPTLFRLKGWVRFPGAGAFLDFAAGQYRLKPTEARSRTSLAFVGRNCSPAEILGALSGCLVHVGEARKPGG